MFDINKTSKIGLPPIISSSLLNTNLSELDKQMQILKSEIVIVSDLADNGDVIFTTVDGGEKTAKAPFYIQIGDKIRVEELESGSFEIVSIYEKKAQDPKQLPLSNYVKLNQIDNTSILDRRLKVGETFVGFIINQEKAADLNSHKDKEKIIAGKRYFFKLISIDSLEGLIEEEINIEEGLVGNLNEILSEDLGSENTISGRVNNDAAKLGVIKTQYGNILITGARTIEAGANVILLNLGLEHNSENLGFDKEILEQFFSKLRLFQSSAKNIIKLVGSEASTRALSLLGTLFFDLQKIKVDKKESVNNSLINELISNTNGADETKFVNDIAFLSNQMNTFIAKYLEEVSVNGWIVFHIPIQNDEELTQHRFFLKFESKNLVRVITNLSLKNLGEIQIDALFYLENKQGIRTKVSKIDIVIRHKLNINRDIRDAIKNEFVNLLSNAQTSFSIKFDRTNNFYSDKEITNNEVKEDSAIESLRDSIIV